LEALRLAVQAESAPVAVRQVKEDLSGLKIIPKVCLQPCSAPQIFYSASHPPQDDGAFSEAVTKSKSKKERSQNKAVIDVADLFAGHFFGFFCSGSCRRILTPSPLPQPAPPTLPAAPLAAPTAPPVVASKVSACSALYI
jgi:hypothetical protein